MSRPKNLRKFRVNPIEVAILSVTSFIFIHSVYTLFYVESGFHPASLTAMKSNPISEGRSLASITQPLETLDIQCDETSRITQASKVRFRGTICEMSQSLEEPDLFKATITNQTNAYHATVFSDVGKRKFSTEYIPLITGQNQIHIEFAYGNDKTFSQDITINH